MTITYTNTVGESLTFRQQKPYFIQRIDGTGNLRNTVTTFKAPDQDGAFFISGSMEMRNITLEGSIVCATSDEAYAARKRLLHVFTPKLKGTLVFRNAQIPCVVEEAGFIAGVRERAPAFFISLLCPSPFFEALDELRVEIAVWLGRFQFPLEITENAGVEFGIRQPGQIIDVENDGEVPCGCTIIFNALGTVVNPELMNITTGEVMRINKTMTAGEAIRIDTHFAGKRVTGFFNGEEHNYFKYVDTVSVFFQFEPGSNTLRYNADANVDLLECRFLYRPLYLGV